MKIKIRYTAGGQAKVHESEHEIPDEMDLDELFGRCGFKRKPGPWAWVLSWQEWMYGIGVTMLVVAGRVGESHGMAWGIVASFVALSWMAAWRFADSRK
jgi:hypothetical protein